MRSSPGFIHQLIRVSVPVIVAFTKSDLCFPQIWFESENYEYRDRTRSRAYAQCEQLCRPLFHREPRDVPAELVSGDYFPLLEMALLTSSFVCSDAAIWCSSKQSNCDHGPVNHGLSYCFSPFCAIEFAGNGATDCPHPSCVVRGFEGVSRYFD